MKSKKKCAPFLFSFVHTELVVGLGRQQRGAQLREHGRGKLQGVHELVAVLVETKRRKKTMMIMTRNNVEEEDHGHDERKRDRRGGAHGAGKTRQNQGEHAQPSHTYRLTAPHEFYSFFLWRPSSSSSPWSALSLLFFSSSSSSFPLASSLCFVPQRVWSQRASAQPPASPPGRAPRARRPPPGRPPPGTHTSARFIWKLWTFTTCSASSSSFS